MIIIKNIIMAPNKNYNKKIIKQIIIKYTEADDICWEHLLNDLYRYMNEDVPLINGYTERFRHIAEYFMKLDPKILEYLPIVVEEEKYDIICKRILKKINTKYLIQCHKFLLSI